MAKVLERVTLGFIGVGSIGRPMADRLLESGHSLAVYDINPEALAYFDGRAICAGSPRAVADMAEVVLSCLPSLDANRQAIIGKGGIVEGERIRLYVHTGTTGVPLLHELISPLAERDIAVVDAPITGGVPRAKEGKLTAIVSGDDAHIAWARPYLEAFANKVVKVGDDVGAAQQVKLINNFLSAANLALACEALVVARKAGLDLDAVLDVINNGSGQNNATLAKLPQFVVPRQFNRGGSIGLMMKDLHEAAHEAQRLGVPTPLGDAVRSSFQRALEAGVPDDDVTSIVRHMERAAGMYLD